MSAYIIENTLMSLNVFINKICRYQKVHAYLPAVTPGEKLRMFKTGAKHSEPPHNLTIVKVSDKF